MGDKTNLAENAEAGHRTDFEVDPLPAFTGTQTVEIVMRLWFHTRDGGSLEQAFHNFQSIFETC